MEHAEQQTLRSIARFVITGWFKRSAVWVTLSALVPATILARSASEGSGYTRLRFELVCRGCYPQLNHVRDHHSARSVPSESLAPVTERIMNNQPGEIPSVEEAQS
jgi:hypothetical protein